MSAGPAARIWNATRLNLRVQLRSGFVQVYVGVAVATVLGVRLAVPETYHALAVTIALSAEFGMLGLTLAAAQHFLEKGEGSLSALFVTPLRDGERIAAVAAASALLSTLAGSIVFAGILGPDARLALLAPPLFLAAALASLIGLILAWRHHEFSRFVLAMVPFVALLQAPLLAYLGVVPRWAVVWIPFDPAVFSFANLAHGAPDPLVWALQAAELVAFLALAGALAVRGFARVRERAEALA